LSLASLTISSARERKIRRTSTVTHRPRSHSMAEFWEYYRPRPRMGTQAPAAAPVLRRRPHRPTLTAACGCASPPPGPGPVISPPRSPVCRPLHPAADQHQTTPAARKDKPRARGTPLTRLTRRDSRAVRHGGTLKATECRSLSRPHQDRETSRLVQKDADPSPVAIRAVTIKLPDCATKI
jgi:hypothetical protein